MTALVRRSTNGALVALVEAVQDSHAAEPARAGRDERLFVDHADGASGTLSYKVHGPGLSAWADPVDRVLGKQMRNFVEYLVD